MSRLTETAVLLGALVAGLLLIWLVTELCEAAMRNRRRACQRRRIKERRRLDDTKPNLNTRNKT